MHRKEKDARSRAHIFNLSLNDAKTEFTTADFVILKVLKK